MVKPVSKQLVTVAVGSLLLILILLGALLAPPSPERVVYDLLVSIRTGDDSRLENLTTGPALDQLQAAVISGTHSQWRVLWEGGSELFEEFRIAEAEIDGNEAVVTVLYGPGLLKQLQLVLLRQDRRWRVYDLH